MDSTKMTWFTDHYNPTLGIKGSTINDICKLFKHTTGHETAPAEVKTTLESQGIEVLGGFKAPESVAYECSTHHVLHIGFQIAGTKSTEYVTYMHNLADGVLTIDKLRRGLLAKKVVSEKDYAQITFFDLGSMLTDEIPLYLHTVYVKPEVKKKYVIADCENFVCLRSKFI